MRLTSRRVAVTGIGIISALGRDHDEVFDALCLGKNGISRITRFDVSESPSKIGGIVPDFDATEYFPDRARRRILRMTDWIQRLGMCAAEAAVQDARLDGGAVPPERLGVFFGVGRGGQEAVRDLVQSQVESAARLVSTTALSRLFEQYDSIVTRAARQTNPVHFLQQCPVLTSAYVSMAYQARGPTLTNVNLCSAGSQAIGEAAWLIHRGDADVMLAGGADSMLNPVELTAFCALDAVSGSNDHETASKPFDLGRDGCVVGEGAAALVLEEMSHARRRGARAYAELIGYGSSSDAYKVSAPPPDGQGAVSAMRLALSHAGLAPEQVDHVNAHGTSTPLNDRTETLAIKTVLGSHAYRIPVVSTKGATGHLIAAAGALEAAVSVKCVQRKRIPPTRNLERRDPNCDLDYAPEGARDLPDLRTVLSNSFAIGGSNACLIFADPEAGLA